MWFLTSVLKVLGQYFSTYMLLAIGIREASL